MTIVLYAAAGSNCSERIAWVLAYKGIPHEKVDVLDEELKSSYLAINPFGVVPAVSVDGFLLSESMAIAEYLEERFPETPLLGNEINRRASIRKVCEYVNGTLHSPQSGTVLNFFRPELSGSQKTETRASWLRIGLERLESCLCIDSGFTVGSSFSLADIFVASIYKKHIRLGGRELEFFEERLNAIRRNPSSAQSAPK